MIAACPEELITLDENALVLWPKLLKRAGVTIAHGEIFLHRRGIILKNFGLPDLLFRLECQKQRERGGSQDERARARMWFHVAEASASGESIPDVSGENRY